MAVGFSNISYRSKQDIFGYIENKNYLNFALVSKEWKELVLKAISQSPLFTMNLSKGNNSDIEGFFRQCENVNLNVIMSNPMGNQWTFLNKINQLGQVHIIGCEFNDLTVSTGNDFNIGDFDEIETLTLTSCNDFSIPGGIEKLKNLTDLTLKSRHYLTREIENLEFSQLCHLTRFVSLGIAHPDGIDDMMEYPINLKEIKLTRTNLEEIPPTLSNLSQLQKFTLELNTIYHGRGRREYIALPNPLESRSLQTLNLSMVDIGVLTEIDMPKLTRLNLGGSTLTEIPESLTQIHSLTELNVNFCHGLHIPEALSNRDDLEISHAH